MNYWTVPLMWQGETVSIVGGGPTLTEPEGIIIVTNGRFRRFPNAEMLVGIDTLWWWENPDALKFPGLKVSTQQVAGVHPNVPKEVLILKKSGVTGYDPNPDSVRTGTNTGYTAIHIAAQAGAKQIELHSFDMRDSMGRPFRKWIEYLEQLRIELARLGVAVINRTPGSCLEWK